MAEEEGQAKPTDEIPNNTWSLASMASIPQLFVAFIGFIYATGFLAVYSFFNNFGLKGVGLDFFKIKYLYIGTLFIMFPIALVIPALSFYYLRHFHKKSKSDEYRLYIPGTIPFINMILVTYLFIVFAPRGFIREETFFGNKFLWILIILLTPIFGLIYIRSVQRRFPNHQKLLRWFICSVILCDIPLLDGLWLHLGNMIKDGAIYFLILMLFLGTIAYRIVTLHDRPYDAYVRNHFFVVLICTLIASYFFGVYTFGLRIYPYIPVQKGGGDYTNSAFSIIYFQDKSSKVIPKQLLSKKGMISKRVIIVEEDSSIIFVVDPNDAGGPTEWRKMGGRKPEIYEIRKERVGSIVTINNNENHFPKAM